MSKLGIIESVQNLDLEMTRTLLDGKRFLAALV
jgi:hypothetical protein